MDLNIFTIDVYLNFDQTEDFRACYSFLNKSILIRCICTYKSFNLDLFETWILNNSRISKCWEIRINICEIA